MFQWVTWTLTYVGRLIIGDKHTGWGGEERNHRAFERRFWVATLVVSIVVMAGAIASAIFTYQSAAEARMTRVASNRAWLSAEYLNGAKLGVSTRFMLVNVDVNITNHGHSPAFSTHYWLILTKLKIGSTPSGIDLAKKCDESKSVFQTISQSLLNKQFSLMPSGHVRKTLQMAITNPDIRDFLEEDKVKKGTFRISRTYVPSMIVFGFDI